MTGLDENDPPLRVSPQASFTQQPSPIAHVNFKSSNWIENFAPNTKTDLAIHPKKIAELEDWFRLIEAQKKQSHAPPQILLITGPSGSGKTASLKVVAKELNYNINEWITPTDLVEYNDNDISNNNYNSEKQNEKFAQFLLQSSRYGSVFDSCAGKRLVLVEDFPNIFIRDPSLFEDILE